MQISYKWWYISRDTDNGLITEAAVRFYEGEDREVEVEDPETGEETTEVRYVITGRLTPSDIPELDGEYKQEDDGSYARVYTAEDFGSIETNEELILFVNNEMAKHEERNSQEDQAELSDITKVK